MKRIIALLIAVVFFSCNAANHSNRSNENEKNVISNERIDGPANIREEPNGRLFMELFDNVKVDAAELDGDWFEIVIFAEFKQSDFNDGEEKTLIKAGRSIVQDGETIGKLTEDIEVYIFEGGTRILGILKGYTHKDNIKEYSIIERAIEKKLTDGEMSFSNWELFISKFELYDTGLEFNNLENIKSFIMPDNYAQMGPSPGPRVILIFDEETLIGFYHSRSLNIEDNTTIKLERYGSLSIFKNYPEDKKKVIVDRLNKWLVYEMN